MTVFFIATCADNMSYDVRVFGMKMRLHMVQRLGSDPAPDMFVKCANERRVRGCALPLALRTGVARVHRCVTACC